MRWHPAIIKWAFAIHSKSASAYRVLRNSGFLQLPHISTLYRYTHFTDPQTGINADLLQRYITELKLLDRPLHERCVNLIFDEMKIKSGLAFSQRTGKIIGFVDVGDVSDEMEAFERHCQEEGSSSPALASHVLLFLARSITSSMKFPVAYYGTQNVTASQLYPLAMDCIEALHYMGLTVKCITSDGASSNRKFYKLLGGESNDDKPQHKCKNIFSGSGYIYFNCDAPHLLKTTRNNFENSNWSRKSRNLMVSSDILFLAL